MLEQITGRCHSRFNPSVAAEMYDSFFHEFESSQGPHKVMTESQVASSPWNVFVNKRLRQKYGIGQSQSGIPTDVFVFGVGEPEDPRCTKVGGRPFWPKDKPWPTNAIGDPCHFLGQFNFSDSRDITPQVPDDILIVTSDTDDEAEWIYPESNCLRFFWISNAAIPECDIQVPTLANGVYFGAICREQDFPSELYSSKAGEDPVFNPRLAVWESTKIGGFPAIVQGQERPKDGFICQLSGDICPTYDVPYGWANLVDPIPIRLTRSFVEGDIFVFADGGSLFFYLRECGQIAWDAEGY